MRYALARVRRTDGTGATTPPRGDGTVPACAPEAAAGRHDGRVIKTPLTRWFDLSTPIIGAPMAGVAGGELARAVSLGGGLGMIGVSGGHHAGVRDRAVRDPRRVRGALRRRADDLGAREPARPVRGDDRGAHPAWCRCPSAIPAPYVGPLHDAGIAVASQVNTAADVARALDAGVDVIVAQGTEAGGHTGRRATLPLLQEVLTLTDRPVVAAGGIATGARDGGRARRGRRGRLDRHRRCCPARRG